jgi:hypothetical protein
MITLWLCSALAAEHATLSVHASLGHEVIVSVVDDDQASMPGQTLTVVHHPGSPDEREIGIGITDSLGRVRWKPDQGGVAVLRVGDHDALRFDIATPYPSPSALVPLALAFLAGVGALIRGWRK